MQKLKRVVMLIMCVITMCAACFFTFGCSTNRTVARVDFSSNGFECSVTLTEQKKREDITIPYTGEAYKIVAYQIKNGEEYTPPPREDGTPPTLEYGVTVEGVIDGSWTRVKEVKEPGRYCVSLNFWKLRYAGSVYFTIE